MGYSKWHLVPTGDKYYIKRYERVDGKTKWESYKGAKYTHLPKDEIESLLRRLNATYEQRKKEAEERYDFDHAYINIKVQEEFERQLKMQINNLENVASLMNFLRSYTFRFFVHQEEMPSPVDWPKKEAAFGEFLLNTKKSISLVTRVIQTTNRFLEFLHLHFPEEIPVIILNPVPQTKVNYLYAQIEMNKKSGDFFINDETWIIIKNKIDRKILPHVRLAHDFGLRNSEVLGQSVDYVYEDFLHVERQLLSVGDDEPTYGPLKSREVRDVPFWFMKPDEAYEVIKRLPIIHPDTLTHMFASEMVRIEQVVRKETGDKSFSLPFQFRHLRNAFITKALRKHHHRDVQLAAGHSDINTTMSYAMDDREKTRKKFRPGGST